MNPNTAKVVLGLAAIIAMALMACWFAGVIP